MSAPALATGAPTAEKKKPAGYPYERKSVRSPEVAPAPYTIAPKGRGHDNVCAPAVTPKIRTPVKPVAPIGTAGRPARLPPSKVHRLTSSWMIAPTSLSKPGSNGVANLCVVE